MAMLALSRNATPLRSEAAARAVAAARRFQPRLNAFAEMEKAAPSSLAGPLAGIPYAAKDMLAVRGRAATWGLAQAPGPAAEADAGVLAALDGAGAARIGFTRMTELAYEPSGLSASQPAPVNPWNPDAICGGSSSGSAVAVAAGIVPLAIGSDTAGSLRIPAQCCGVTAWKPTPGLVPMDGAMPLAPTLDVLGFLARDAALLQRVAPLFAPEAPRPAAVAVAHDLVAEAEPTIASAVAAVAAALAGIDCALSYRAVRAVVEACDVPLLTILQAEAASSHRALLAGGALDPLLSRRLAKGLEITPDALAAARDRAARLRREAPDLLFGEADALLLPVMRMETPTVAAVKPDSPAFRARTLYELSAFTRFVNMLGLPAVAVPAGFDRRGWPIAVQIVGRAGGDRGLLALAAAVQARTDWHGRTPLGLGADAAEGFA